MYTLYAGLVTYSNDNSIVSHITLKNVEANQIFIINN